MPKTPVYGWPVPLRTDRPAGATQLTDLGEAVEKTLAEQAGRSAAQTTRPAEASGGAGAWVPLAATATIPAATAGLYVVHVTGACRRAGGAGTVIQMRISVNGVTLSDRTIAEVTDDYTRPAVALLQVAHGGGLLQVAAEVRGVTAGVFAHAGSVIGAARVSA